MSKHVKHVPKHRSAPAPSTLTIAPRKALRTTVVLSSVAAAATGATISGGLLAAPAAVTAAGSAGTLGGDVTAAAAEVRNDPDTRAAADAAAAEAGERTAPVSRSADRRAATDPAKEAALGDDRVAAVSGEQKLSDSDPRDIARALLPEFGFSSDQFGCLDSLYMRESGWNPTADNPTSSAYGIPQALPGSKMASAGADWATNPVTQIRWGLGYIQDRYGSPCSAWGHSQSVGWY